LRERVSSVARRVGVLPLVLGIATAAAAAAAEPPPGASSCSGCHPPSAAVETKVPPLRGHDPAEIVAAMQAFRSGERPSTVMGRIAKGFSDGETRAIAARLAAQR
jgi:cytochrome subunit of sulfide dehydrogenase